MNYYVLRTYLCKFRMIYEYYRIIECDAINFESEHVYELVSNSKVNIKRFILPSSSYEKYKQVSRSLK